MYCLTIACSAFWVHKDSPPVIATNANKTPHACIVDKRPHELAGQASGLRRNVLAVSQPLVVLVAQILVVRRQIHVLTASISTTEVALV